MHSKVWVLLLSLIMGAGLGAAIAISGPLQEKKNSEDADRAKYYKKWLTEDVDYIISDEERAVFKALKTDEEREKFIEQFWLQRDPTPGTDENEFKEEHYRRIAYANERFSTGIPGWRTDRGHMYIVYGPPDEIENHPKSAEAPHAYLVWMYQHVEGVGNRVFITFVDRSDTGDYRLAPGASG